MSQFTDVLLVSPLADGRTWVIMRPFGYDVGAEGSGNRIDVPIGFQTDFASIPRVFWAILPKWGTYGNASVVHDWMYWEQARPRAEADGVFLEAMGVLGVGRVVSQAMYWAVRGFGWIAWWRNQADRRQGVDRVLPDVRLKASARAQRRPLLAQVGARAWRTLRRGPG